MRTHVPAFRLRHPALCKAGEVC